MRTDIIEYLEDEIKRRCESENNFFGMGCFYHIRAVVENAIILAKQYHADMEIVIVSAWLHDIASITDYQLYDKHHIHGSKIAREILEDMNYPLNRIEKVQKCILNHRGSKLVKKDSIEEICVADADAISHFDSLPSLFYLAYEKRQLGIEEGRRFVCDKLTRSYQKLSEESKEIFKEKYDITMQILK